MRQVFAKGKVSGLYNRSREGLYKMRYSGSDLWQGVLLFMLFRIPEGKVAVAGLLALRDIILQRPGS